MLRRIVAYVRCYWIGQHAWSKWSRPYEAWVQVAGNSRQPIAMTITQRHCHNCWMIHTAPVNESTVLHEARTDG